MDKTLEQLISLRMTIEMLKIMQEQLSNLITESTDENLKMKVRELLNSFTSGNPFGGGKNELMGHQR